MISQPIKLVGDRQKGARAQFVAWPAVDNSKIYVRPYEGISYRIDR